MNNQPQFHKVVQVLFIFCSLLGNPNMEGVMDSWYSWFLTIMTTSDDRCHNLTHECLWLVCAHYNFASTPSPILAAVLCAIGTTSGGTTTCTASSGYIKSPAFAVSWMSARRCQTCILKLKTCQLTKCNYSNSVEKFRELCQLAIQDIDVSIKIILAMEDFQKRQLQKGFPLSVVALCFPTREAKREESNDIVINSSMLRSIGEEHSSKYAP